MSSIDQRVVQMKFDNKEFEAGIQQSLKSLENLQKGLDLKGATEGIKNIEKSVNSFNVSGMSKSIDAIAEHFTWLGRTIDHTLDNITNKVIAVGSNMVRSLSVDQVSVGWEKFEEKTRSVGTIISATGKSVDEVNESLEKLNWFTDETSYNFTDMVNNVGKFTSVGVDLDDAVTAMQGIANAAALAGGGVGEASRAMYNFSQAMGTGKLLLQDWKSIELANMATQDFKNSLIESGLAMGTLVKQGEEYVTTTTDGVGAISSFKDANEGFRDSLSAGWITTEVMMDTFKKYGEYANEIYKITESEGITAAEAMEKFSDESMKLGERAFKAAQEARTFTDAINATKDAVSTGWMQSFEIIFGNYEQAKEMWTDLANTLWDVFAGGAEARNDMLRETFQEAKNIVSTSDWENIASDIPFLDTFKKAIVDTAKEHGAAIDQIYTDDAAFLTLLESGQITTDLLNEALSRTGGVATEAGKGLSGTKEKLAELEKVAKRVLNGDFGNGDKRIKALTEAGYDYKEVQTAVNQLLKGQAITVEELSDSELKQIGYTDEQIRQLKQLKKAAEETGTPLNELIETMNRPTGRELMLQAASNAFEGLMKAIQAVKDAWSDVFPPITSERLYNIIERIRDFSENLIISDDHADKLKRTFRGVFAIFDLFGQSIMFIAKSFAGVIEFLEPFGETVLSVGAKIGDLFYDLSSNFRKLNVFGHISNGILKVFRTLASKLRIIRKTIAAQLEGSGVFEPVKKAWSSFFSWVESKGGIVGLIDSFFNLVNGWVSKMNATKIGRSIVAFVKGIKDGFKDLPKIGEFIKNFSRSISDFFKGLGEKLWNVITKAFSFVNDGLKTGIEWLGKGLDSVFNFIQERIPPIVEIIRSILLLGILRNVNRFTKIFGDLFKAITGVIEKFAELIKQIGKAIKKYVVAKAREANAEAIFKVALSIGVLVAAIYVLTKLDPNKVYDALTVIGVLAAGLVIFYKQLGEADPKGGKKISGFLGVGVAIYLLVRTMMLLSGMDIESIIESMIEVGALLEILAQFTNRANTQFKASNGAGLLLTAFSLQLFVLAMVEIAHMKPENVVKGLAGLGALLYEVAGFTQIADSEFKFSNGAALIMTGLSLQLFVLAMVEIAHMKPENVVKGLAGLGALLIEVGGFTRLASKEIKFSSMASLIPAAVGILIFGESMKNIGLLDTDQILKGVIGLGVVLAEVGSFTKKAKGMDLSSGFGTALSMVSLIVLVPLFRELSTIPEIEKIGVSFGAALYGIGKGIEALSKVGGIAGGASAAAAILPVAGVIAAIIAIVIGIAGVLDQFEGAKQFVKDAGEMLGLLGEAIGMFIGGIGLGAMEMISVGLEELGTALSVFWTNAQGFIIGLASLPQGSFAAAGELATAILKLTAAEVLDGIAKWIGGGEQNLETFGNELTGLGEGLKNFSEKTKGINQDAVTGAANALATLVSVQVPASGGLLQKMIGETNFGSFGVQLTRLGRHLGNFSGYVNGIDDNGFNNMKKAASAISDLVAADIPTVGGFVDVIVGRTDWGVFGEQLEAFGPHFKQFADDIKGINTTGLPDAAEALGKLLKIDAPKNDWGIIQVFTGSTDWGKFGDQLEDFGSGFKNFAVNMSGVTSEMLSGVDPAIESMKKLLEINPPKTDGFFTWLVGQEDNLGDFGTDLGTLGEGFHTFYTNIGDVNIEDLTQVVGLLERLGTFANNISSTVTDDIGNFAFAISMLEGVDLDPLLNLIDDWDDEFESSGTNLAEILVQAIAKVLKTDTSPATNLRKLLTTLSEAIGSFNMTFYTRGSDIIKNFVNGMKSRGNDVWNAGMMLANNGRNSLEFNYNSFYNSGVFLMEGFVAGMKDMVYDVQNAAAMLAHVANTTFNNYLRIASPSKATMESGHYFGEGFVIGLQNESRNIENQSGELAMSALDSFKTAVAMVESIINNTVDLQPMIRPVVDLNSVQSSADQINSLFSGTQTIGLGGYQNPFIPTVLSQIGANMGGFGDSSYLQVDNSDVIQAIRDLEGEVQTLKDVMANLQVIMDSGALVGQIIDRVDNELGKKALYNGRRI